MSKFFLERFWPTVVLVSMVIIYLVCRKCGMSTFGALAAAAWAGFITFVVMIFTLKEYAGRMRMSNPIALWTTFFTAMAPIGPAVFVERSTLAPISALIVIMMFSAAGFAAYLMERAIIGGQCREWYVQYGLAPFAVLWAACGEASDDHLAAGLTLVVYWFGHFFYKQLPRIVDSLRPNVKRSPEDG